MEHFTKSTAGMAQAKVTRYPYIWFWNASQMRIVNRKSQRCRVLVRGTMNSALIEFEDASEL
jgi:hypothetical protein